MAYLITGGTGQIGSYVVRNLVNQGKEVACLQRSGITRVFRDVVGLDNLDRVKIVRGSISDTFLLFNIIKEYGIDKIIHLGFALPVDGGISETQPALALQVNCLGMANFLEAMRLLNVKKMVWTSSVQAFGRVAEFYKDSIKDDDALYASDSMYSATKSLDEYLTKHYHNQFGVDCTGLRIGYILCPERLDGILGQFSNFLKHVALEKPATLTAKDADSIRYLGYVETTADMIIKACEAPTTETRMFNAIEYPCSARQLIDTIYKIHPEAKVKLEVTTEITRHRGEIINEAAWPGTPEPVLDYSGIRQELNWQPKYVLEEALQRIFNHFRKQEKMPLI